MERPGYEPELKAPADTRIHYVYREDGKSEGLLSAIRALPWPAGRVHAFVHGEAHEVMREIRPHLLADRAVARADVSISGYWRAGSSEEGFREWKSEFGRSGNSAT